MKKARSFISIIYIIWNSIVIGFGISIFSDDVKDYVLNNPVKTFIGVLLFFIGSSIFFLIWRKQELKEQFALFKESHLLTPEDLRFKRINPGQKVSTDYRPYYDTYIPRTAINFSDRDKEFSLIDPAQIYSEKQLIHFLKNSSGLLLIGGPTEGKTRTLFEIIRQLPRFIVIKIKLDKVPDDRALNLLRNRNVLWLVDNLHVLAEDKSSQSGASSSFIGLLTKINEIAFHCALAGTSRNAGELDKFNLTTITVREFYNQFKLKLVFTRPSNEDFEKLQKAVGNTDMHRYPTIGSVAMQEHFLEMRARFGCMDDLEQDCVLALILLNEAYIYQMTVSRIERVLIEVLHNKNEGIDKALGRLKEAGFITSKIIDDVVIAEEAYITGEEAEYYYSTGTKAYNKKPQDDLDNLGDCLLNNRDAEGMNQLAISRYYANEHERAINYWKQVDIRFRESSEPVLQEWVAKALFNRGVTLGKDRSDEAINCYELIEESYGETTEPVLQEWVAKALSNRGVALGNDRPDEAIGCFKLLEERFGETTEPVLQLVVAKALFDRGVTLGNDRPDEAIGCFKLLEERFGETTYPALQILVAKALFDRGVTLGNDRPDEEISCYELIDKRYGDTTDPALQELVAMALVNKGVALGKDRPDEAIGCFKLLEERFGETTDPALQELVAMALVNKGVALGNDRPDEAIGCFKLLEERFGETTDPALQIQVASALVNRGITLGQDRPDEEISCYELVDKRYGDTTDPALQEQVAMALVNRGITLGKDKPDEAINCYELVDKRYGDTTDPALQILVAKALFNRGVLLTKNRPDEAIECYVLIEERFGETADPALQELVARALFKEEWYLETTGRMRQSDAMYW